MVMGYDKYGNQIDVPIGPDGSQPLSATMDSTSGGGSGDISITDLTRAISDILGGLEYEDAKAGSLDEYSKLIALGETLRKGQTADTESFYDRMMSGAAGDLGVGLGLMKGVGEGSARAEQYGKDLTGYADARTAAAISALLGQRDSALGDIKSISEPMLKAAMDEIANQRRLGGEVIDFTKSGAERQRELVDPALVSTMTRFQAPSQYSPEGIKGTMKNAATSAVGRAYDDTTRAAVTQALRSGTSAGGLLEDLGRQRSDALSDAMTKAELESIGVSDKLNMGKRTGEADNFSKLTDTILKRDALVPQAYDTASKGSLGATGNLTSASGQAMDAISRPYIAGMQGTTDLSKTGIAAGAKGFELGAAAADSGDKNKTALLSKLLGEYGASSRTAGASMFDSINRGYATQGDLSKLGYQLRGATKNANAGDTTYSSLLAKLGPGVANWLASQGKSLLTGGDSNVGDIFSSGNDYNMIDPGGYGNFLPDNLYEFDVSEFL